MILLLRRLLLPFDALLAAVLLALGAPVAALAARCLRRSGDRHLLMMTPGASCEAFEKNFGDFWWYIESHAAGGYFRRVTLFYYPLPRTFRTVRREAGPFEIVVCERPSPLRLFHLAAAAAVVLEAAVRARLGRAIVRSHDMYFHGLMGWAAARLAGVPFVISVHTDYRKYAEISGRPTYAIAPSWGWMEALSRFLFRRADLVWAISRHIAGTCVREGCPPGKIRVVYHAVAAEAWAAPAEAEAFLRDRDLAGRPYVAFAGRIHKEKRVFDCLDLAVAVRRRVPAAVVAVAGEGPDRAALEAEVARRGLGDAVRLLGCVPHRLVGPFLARGVAFFPMAGCFALIDAALNGAPVVAYDVEWHGELIEEGVTGRLVPEGDVAAAAAAAADLLERPGEAARLGAALRARALERHVPEAHNRAAAAFYDEAYGGV